MINFIFMLTHNDATVPNAIKILEELQNTGLSRVGFKDVGATPEVQRKLTDIAHVMGMTVYLEVVSTTKSDEINSVEAGLQAGVDWILGGTYGRDTRKLIAGSQIKFAPFPGQVTGHPSVLQGSIEKIVKDSQELVMLEGIDGVDLLAYRHRDLDPIELTEAVVKTIAPKPVIAAGSVTSKDQILALAKAGASAFTIGGAIFENRLPAPPDVVSQVRCALRFAEEG